MWSFIIKKTRFSFYRYAAVELADHFIMSAKPLSSYTVFVEGNIGSGKTTFLNHFRNSSDVSTLTEPVELWRNLRNKNFLELMYKDPSRWGITFQTYVQLTMVKLHTQNTNTPFKLMERSLHSARHCFVENLYKNGLMPEPDYIVLDEWYNWICNNLSVSGNLIVYLRTTPEVIHKRILARARTEESSVPLEYLKQLHDLHEEWLLGNSKKPSSIPVQVIDANQDLSDMENVYISWEKEFKNVILKDNSRAVHSSPIKAGSA